MIDFPTTNYESSGENETEMKDCSETLKTSKKRQRKQLNANDKM